MKDNIKLILLALFLFVGQSAWAEIITGECGQESGKMFYSLNTETGELYIWGEGLMLDQQFDWDSYKKQIKSVYIEGYVSSIGVDAFSGCTNLTDVVIAVTWWMTWGDFAFEDCKSLKNVTYLGSDMPSDLEDINEGNRPIFYHASTDITMHCTESFQSNCEECFPGWKFDNHMSGKNRFGVTWDYLDHTLTLGGVETLGYENWVDEPVWQDLFNDYEMTTKLVIGGGVKTIADGSFRDASFQELVLDEGVRTVGEYAFGDNYSLQKVTLASSVSTIEPDAFLDCEELSYVQINNMNKVYFYEGCFSGIAEEGQIVIPVGAYDYTIADLHYAGFPLYDKNNNLTDNWTKKYTYDSPALALQHGLAYDVKEQRNLTSLSYTRLIGKSEVGKWLPICVPFSFYEPGTSSSYDIAEIHGIMPTKDTNMNGQVDTNDEVQLVLTPFSGISQPNVCYMIRPRIWESCFTLRAIGDRTLYPADQTSVELSTSRNRFTITNVYEDFSISQDDNYFCVRGGKLVHPENGGTVEPFAWVLRADKRNVAGQRFIADMKTSPLKIVLLGETEAEEGASISSITNIIDDLNNCANIKTVHFEDIEQAADQILER